MVGGSRVGAGWRFIRNVFLLFFIICLSTPCEGFYRIRAPLGIIFQVFLGLVNILFPCEFSHRFFEGLLMLSGALLGDVFEGF